MCRTAGLLHLWQSELSVICANSRVCLASSPCSVTIGSVTARVILIAQLQPVIFPWNDTGRRLGTRSLGSLAREKAQMEEGVA